MAPDGTWTMTVPPLAAGTHSLVAKLLGADGKEQAASAPIELTVADGQVVVTTPAPSAALTAAPVAGAPAIKLPAAGLKASEPLTLEGTGTPGSTVTVYDGDEVVGETTLAPDGTWTAHAAAAGCRGAQPGGQGARRRWQGAGCLSARRADSGGRADRRGDARLSLRQRLRLAAATAVTSAAPVAGKAPEIKRPAPPP